MFLFWISDLQYYDKMPPPVDIQFQFVMKAMKERPKYFSWLQWRAAFALML